MGRVGLTPENTLDFIKKVRKLKNVTIEGIYTHFASADTNEEYTKKQIRQFESVLDSLKKEQIGIPYVHAAASSGILNFPESYYNLVRPGIIVYGYLPDESLTGKINLKPSTKLKSTVAFLKTVPKGTKISYSGTYETTKETKIATIPMGYADGYRRLLSNKADVLIRGKRAPIIGTVCMDNFMVDVSHIPDVRIGDEVTLWDNEEITIEELARKCGTISYELLSTISRRVPRKYRK